MAKWFGVARWARGKSCTRAGTKKIDGSVVMYWTSFVAVVALVRMNSAQYWYPNRPQLGLRSRGLTSACVLFPVQWHSDEFGTRDACPGSYFVSSYLAFAFGEVGTAHRPFWNSNKQAKLDPQIRLLIGRSSSEFLLLCSFQSDSSTPHPDRFDI